jgi:DNA-binding transcriptional LysR family regulator
VRPAYGELAAALAEARAAARGVSGVLRVGCTATTPSEPLTRLVAAFEAAHPDCRVTLCEHPSAASDWDVWRPLRAGESDVLMYWNCADEPDLTVGPVLAWLDRVLLVGRGHRLAGRDSVPAEELAGEQVLQSPPSLPPAIRDAMIPPFTPSGRPIPRTEEPSTSLHGVLSLVARGHMVHPTVTGVVMFRRDDIVAVPLTGLPPVPLGLTWCTAYENARIRALAAAAAIAPRPVTGAR